MCYSMYRSFPLRSTLNTGYIKVRTCVRVCTEAVHCVALGHWKQKNAKTLPRFSGRRQKHPYKLWGCFHESCHAKKGRCGFSHSKRGLTTGLDQLWHVPASRPPCCLVMVCSPVKPPPVLMEGKHPCFASGKNPSFGNKEKKKFQFGAKFCQMTHGNR